MSKFCYQCGKETRHQVLKGTRFLAQGLMALITCFGVDLREPGYECNNCGAKS